MLIVPLELRRDVATIREVERLVRGIARDRDRLRSLGVVRTERTIADYVEWLVARRLHLRLSRSTIQEGFDALDKKGKRYQIKYRMYTDGSTGFDHVAPQRFDFLICVFLDKRSYRLHSAYKVSKRAVERHVRVFKRGKSFRWNKSTMTEPGIQRVM